VIVYFIVIHFDIKNGSISGLRARSEAFDDTFGRSFRTLRSLTLIENDPWQMSAGAARSVEDGA